MAEKESLTPARQVFDVTRGCAGYEKNLECNWNGNVTFGGTPCFPESVEELCEVVATAPAPLRVVGRGHSFTPLAECHGGSLISLARLGKILDYIPPTGDKLGSITIEGGTTYTQVARYLATRGGALRNLPSSPQFTVAGAIATATHGSGRNIPNLAADVSMLEFVKGDGTIIRYDDSSPLLKKARVHLGCLGVISRLTLDVLPHFQVDSFRYDDVPLEVMIEALPQLWESCDSLSVWTAGFGKGDGSGTCWVVFRHFSGSGHEDRETLMKIHARLLANHGTLCTRPIPRYCTDLNNNPEYFVHTCTGPWYDALTLTMGNGKETSMTIVDMQAEFFVPIENAQEALYAVWKATKEWTFSSPHGHASPTMGDVDAMEFRQIKGGDGAWLSPHAVDSLGIHISFNRYAENVKETMVPVIEEALKPFGATAHWGKLSKHTGTPLYLEEHYGQGLENFRDLCNKHDPTGKFRNSYLSRMLFAGTSNESTSVKSNL